MAYCSNCGDEVVQSASFCDSCGEEITPTKNEVDTGTASASSSVDVDTLSKAVLGSAGLAVLGSILPWYTLFGATVFGFEGDGIITLIVGAVAGAAVWWIDAEKRSLAVGAVCGVIVTLVALYHVRGISDIGVYVTLLGGLGMLGAGAYGYWQLR